MSEKKIVVVIVEGPSDKAALSGVMKEFFSSDEVQFAVVHGDITVHDYVTKDKIIEKVNQQIDKVRGRYCYGYDDFIKIIHIVDMDGAYMDDDKILEVEKEEKYTLYYEDHVETDDRNKIIQRNKNKRDILLKLNRTGKVHGIPYRIYFNSCNLEHVLYGELKDFSDDEKEELSDDFADKYEGQVEEFIKFISSPDIAIEGNYNETWKYIEKENRSLKRGSNMNLIFE